MKLNPRDANRYFAKPDPEKTGILIYGADAMRVALKRQELIAALIGPTGEEEMRLSRIAAADLRKDPALLGDAIKEVSFFPGPRVAFVVDATDAVIDAIQNALTDWQAGDAHIVVTAGQLAPKSKLRTLFEKHPNAYCAALYNDPMGRDEIEAEMSKAGLRNFDQNAMKDLTTLARELDPGDFRQTLEKIALYKMGDETPLTHHDIDACAPASTEAALDDVLHVVAEARSNEIGPLMDRLQAQGIQPVGLCIAAMRHFRTLYAASSHPNGIASVRPPVFGPRHDRMQRQAQNWGAARLETALTILTDTDLQLRSAAQTAPAMALVERALIRLAMLGRR